MWNSLPAPLFPDTFNLQTFKCYVNRYLLSTWLIFRIISIFSVANSTTSCVLAAIQPCMEGFRLKICTASSTKRLSLDSRNMFFNSSTIKEYSNNLIYNIRFLLEKTSEICSLFRRNRKRKKKQCNEDIFVTESL